MTYKGFGTKSQPKLLIKGWLIPENRKHYKFKSNNVNIESLSMTLNMWLAMASLRFKSENPSKAIKNQESALALIVELDNELMRDKEKDGYWYIKIKNDDRYFVDYHRRLINLVKEAINQGEHSRLNGAIQNTWEYKQWMEEAGHILVTQQLLDSWMHPLSEISEASTSEGVKETFNTWMFASLMCGAATGRSDNGNKETCIARLMQLGVLAPEDCKTRLEMSQILDSEYLKLISDCKNALDQKIDAAIGANDNNEAE
jgi:hypothetical protein